MSQKIFRRLEFGSGDSTSQATCDEVASSQSPAIVEPLDVFIRLRPITSKEASDGVKKCISAVNNTTVVLEPPKGSKLYQNVGAEAAFTFTKVFDESTSQGTFFDETTSNCVSTFLRGHDSLVFAYGMTNAGKTYTIQGDLESPQSERRGLLPRTLELIFAAVEARSLGEESLNDVPFLQAGMRRCIYLSYFEVYNEKILDLLDPQTAVHQTPGKGKLSLHEKDYSGRPSIIGLKQVHVTSLAAAIEVLHTGEKNRTVASNSLNQTSSRSHSVFSIVLMQYPESVTPAEAKKNPHEHVRYTRMSVVDLAGSERVSRTDATADSLIETANINTSLSFFKRCMETLRWNQQQIARGRGATHARLVPYRESVLTRYLRSFFLGHTKAVMIVNAAVGDNDVDETVHCIKFAALASQITTTSRIDSGIPATPSGRSRGAAAMQQQQQQTMMIRDLQQELAQLREEHQEQQHRALLSEAQLRSEASDYVLQQLAAKEAALRERYQARAEQLEMRFGRKLAIIEAMLRAGNAGAADGDAADEPPSFQQIVQISELQLKLQQSQARQNTLARRLDEMTARNRSLLEEFERERNALNASSRMQIQSQLARIHELETELRQLRQRHNDNHNDDDGDDVKPPLPAAAAVRRIADAADSAVMSPGTRRERPKSVAVTRFFERMLTPDKRPRPASIASPGGGRLASPPPLVVVSPPRSRNQTTFSYVAVSPAALAVVQQADGDDAVPEEELIPVRRTSPKRTRTQKIGDKVKSPFVKKKRTARAGPAAAEDNTKPLLSDDQLQQLVTEVEDPLSPVRSPIQQPAALASPCVRDDDDDPENKVTASNTAARTAKKQPRGRELTTPITKRLRPRTKAN